MTIKLTLVLSVILEAVKTETYIKGQVDRSVDEKAAKLVYQETLGDEQVHERKLMRNIYNSLDALKNELSFYIPSNGSTAGDNIKATIDTVHDKIEIFLSVSDLFNTAMTDSLARCCSKYIEDSTLVLWWGVFNTAQAEFYNSMLVADTAAIGKCFVKAAPQKTSPKYTTSLETVGSSIQVSPNVDFTVTYVISDGSVDDIEAFCDNRLLHIRRGQRTSFECRADGAGVFALKLYSLHDEDICKYITVNCSTL